MKILRKVLLWFLALAFLGCMSLYFYCRYVSPFDLQTIRLEISSPYLSKETDNLTLLLFADTHIGPYYDADDFRKAVRSSVKASSVGPSIEMWLSS